MRVLKKVTDVKNIYTYFEFDGYDSWEGLDILQYILHNQPECMVLEQLDGIYSKPCGVDKGSVTVDGEKLFHHVNLLGCSRFTIESFAFTLIVGISWELKG